MKKPGKRNDEELNFWQPTSDMMSGLLYVLMLVIVLMGLTLIQVPEFDDENPELDAVFATPTPTPAEEDDDRHGAGWGSQGSWTTPIPTRDHSGGTGSGGSWEFTPTPSVTPTPTPEPTTTIQAGGPGRYDETPVPWEEEGERDVRAAVHVLMVDAETEHTIRQENVEFELYTAEGQLITLNGYYPERVAYRSYHTEANGTFFLPEMLESGDYEIHALTEPEGYDAAENAAFTISASHDWSDPYVVQVPMSPSRNVIRVQMTDAETRQHIAGGSFEIVAVDDIITADGTIRYRAGQTAGEIVCDETGYGESEEIFTGLYELRQKTQPEYYASYPEPISVEVQRKSAGPVSVNTVAHERTRIHFTVHDELYESRVIYGAELNIVPSRGLPFTAVTDHLGKIRLQEVTAGTTYRVTQVSSGGDYRVNDTEWTVRVEADGRIDGNAVTEISLPNRIIRVSIGVTDEFSSIQVPGLRLTLYDAEGVMLHEWISAGTAQTFTDLEPGNYQIRLNAGNGEQQIDITVRDQAAQQEFHLSTTYLMHYLLYAGIALAVLLTVVLIFVLRRRKKKKAPRKEKTARKENAAQAEKEEQKEEAGQAERE